ncbi:hypothetical protein COOONC_03023 [Cooperia oncophora]
MNPRKCAVNSLNQPQLGISSPGMEDIPVLGSSSLYGYLEAERKRSSKYGTFMGRTIGKALAAAKRIMLTILRFAKRSMGITKLLKYAISCIIYGTGKFGIMRKQAKAFDESIRKLLAESRMRSSHSCISRLYVIKKKRDPPRRKRNTLWCIHNAASSQGRDFKIATVCAKAYEAALKPAFKSKTVRSQRLRRQREPFRLLFTNGELAPECTSGGKGQDE